MPERQPAKREELTGLAAEFAALVPRAQIDRDRLMFAAGRQAASHRLRVVNRILSATSVVCGGLLAMVLTLPRVADAPLAGPALHEVGPQVPAVAKRSNVAGTPSPTVVANRRGGSRLTPADDSANFRLLRLLGRSDGASLVEPLAHSTAPKSQEEAPSNSYPRTLLNRYLQSDSDRL